MTRTGSSPKRKASLTSAGALSILVVVWIALAILVNPIGEFPLNDDWSFARAVYTLVQEGRYRPTGWTAMPLLSHALWGALFCLPFGFSFTALRISTLAMGLLGVLATYGILQETRGEVWVSLLGGLVVAVSPLYFSLSYTFMTDVTFCGFSLLSLFFLIRGLRRGRPLEVIVGHLLACCAALNRQLGVAIPLAFAAAYLIKNGWSWRNLLRAVLPLSAIVAVLFLYQHWLGSTVGLPVRYNRSNAAFLSAIRDVPAAVKRVVHLSKIALNYVGLMSAPFLIPFAVRLVRSSGRRGKVWMGLGFLASTLAMRSRSLIASNGRMPLTSNVLYDLGLGPVLLRDVEILGRAHYVSAPRWVWVAVTAVSIAGAGLLLCLLCAVGASFVRRVQVDKGLSRTWPTVLVASCGLLYHLPIAVTGMYDRYLVFLIPIVVLTLSLGLEAQAAPLRKGGLVKVTSYALVALLAAFSVAATHDYLAWNRARWQALNHLMDELHLSPDEIDGGFEFNGWYGYDAAYKVKAPKSWWWVREDDYLVAFGPVPRYEILKRYIYPRWIPPGEGSVVILHKLPQ